MITARRAGVTAVATAATLLAGILVPASGTRSPTEAHAAPAEDCASAVAARMTLPQQVGQLFVAGVTSTRPSPYQLRLIDARHLGGVVLMGHNSLGVRKTRQVVNTLQARATSAVSLTIAVDQEGGYVQVLHGPGFSEMPTALRQGKLTPDRLRSRARTWGSQLRAAGITLNLAPVLDTVPASLGTGNKPIGYYHREYGHVPGVVSAHGNAFGAGMADARVQPTAKHFPGLGRVRRNTDTSAGVTDTVTTRHDPYLKPFANAVGRGVPVIMVSMAWYRKIDRRRAVFSPTVLRAMLRGDLGFDGVIMSDSMSAAAVRDLSPAQRAVRFLTNGGTVVLDTDPGHIPAMIDAVLAKARGNAGFRGLVHGKVLRVLRQKLRVGLVTCPPPSNPTTGR